jgi:argininosuccinate lyase
MRLWGGRFGEGPDARMADYTRSVAVDRELALDDLEGSIAHVCSPTSRSRPSSPGSRAWPRT